MKREDAIKVAFDSGAWIHTEGNSVLFTPSQFDVFYNAIEARTLERCKKACRAVDDRMSLPAAYGAMECLEALEALKDE